MAQTISGTIAGRELSTELLFLVEVKGGDHKAIDSVRIDRNGRFRFANRNYPAGFYKLALNDSDEVDIILDPREDRVELVLSGRSLQDEVSVVRSAENDRLWKYKAISRESGVELSGLRAMRENTDPLDSRTLRRIDSLEASVDARRRSTLDALLADAPASYFALVVKADRDLMAAIPDGAKAVKDAFPWSDPRLVRCSIYPKAIMAYLQALPFAGPDAFMQAVDSLLSWSGSDTTCWSYTRSVLLRVFDQYGPDEVAQYVVDRYVVGPDALTGSSGELAEVLTERLRVAAGAQGPDVQLPDPVKGDTLHLKDLWKEHRYTALFFYSSTCDHCHQQMPGLKRLYTEFHPRGMQILGIALDADVEEFTATLAQRDLPWPCFSELNGWGSLAAKAYAVKATPNLVLLDGKGTIMSRPLDHEDLRLRIRTLLP